ncbi:hypothetical protein AAD018_001795 [Aestuariibius insulae]|uniref:hypothetical protein n=1 Tax=Aestuariibius insulae TaxID=2058287 RepID=UPI00345E876A
MGRHPTDRPVAEDRLIEVEAGPVEIDIAELEPSEVAVIARPTNRPACSKTGMIQYVAVHRRTGAQGPVGMANDRAGTVQDPATRWSGSSAPTNGSRPVKLA